MLVGVPKEVKNHEYRVGMTPESVAEMVHHGHQVLVETKAGMGIGATDKAYRAAGATVVDSAEEIFARADMIVKVKEPQDFECKRLRPGRFSIPTCTLRPIPSRPGP